MFIDTHCHMNMMVDKAFDELLKEEHFPQIAQVVQAAHDAGVHYIVNVGTSLEETMNSLAIAQRHDNVFATVGIHPCDVKKDWREKLAQFEQMIIDDTHGKIVGVGETGLDYYHQPYDAALQAEAFRAHIELAIKYDKAIVVHVREAGDDALAILREYIPRGARGVIHCFSQDLKAAQEVASWGWCMGIDGPVTYKKNDALREIVATVPLENLLLETDAPFLTPQKFRGKRNSPMYLPLIAEQIAMSRGVSIEEVRCVTSENAKKLFRLQSDDNVC